MLAGPEGEPDVEQGEQAEEDDEDDAGGQAGQIAVWASDRGQVSSGVAGLEKGDLQMLKSS